MLSLFLLMLGSKEAPMLECTIERHGGELTIAYTIENQSKTPMLLFNRLYRTVGTGSFQYDPNAVYVFAEEGGITVAKKLLDHPGRPVEHLEVPGVTHLEPGKRLSEKLTLELPLRERTPYVSGKPKELRGKVRFVLGVIRKIEGLELRPLDEGLQAPQHDVARGRQELLTSGAFEL